LAHILLDSHRTIIFEYTINQLKNEDLNLKDFPKPSSSPIIRIGKQFISTHQVLLFLNFLSLHYIWTSLGKLFVYLFHSAFLIKDYNLEQICSKSWIECNVELFLVESLLYIGRKLQTEQVSSYLRVLLLTQVTFQKILFSSTILYTWSWNWIHRLGLSLPNTTCKSSFNMLLSSSIKNFQSPSFSPCGNVTLSYIQKSRVKTYLNHMSINLEDFELLSFLGFFLFYFRRPFCFFTSKAFDLISYLLFSALQS